MSILSYCVAGTCTCYSLFRSTFTGSCARRDRSIIGERCKHHSQCASKGATCIRSVSTCGPGFRKKTKEECVETSYNLSMFSMIGRKEVFYLTTHSAHFIYDYMASDIWERTIQLSREKSRSCHMGYFFRLTARVLLYASSHRQDNTYHGPCYTSRGALSGTINSSMGLS